MSVTRFLSRSTSTAQSALLVLVPHGGQNLARRNAWLAVSDDAVRADARRDAALAMSQAIGRHRMPATA
jgi:hypothetical protein